MSIATSSDVKAAGNLATDADKDDRVIPGQITRASTQVKKHLGDNDTGSIYDQIDAGTAPYTAADKEALKYAEADWTMSLLAPVINTVTRGSGGITRTIHSGQSAETQFLSQTEIDSLAAKYLSKAIEALEDYAAGPVEEGLGDILLGGSFALAAIPALEE